MANQNLDLFTGSGAVFSPCGKYRYRLWRYWDRGKLPLVWVMLNPSTADELDNDPTVERCERRARKMGFGGVEVVNIFAYRATDPSVMRSQADPVGAENDEAIIAAARLGGTVVCGWGIHGDHLGRGRAVADLLQQAGITAHSLNTTASGHPGHPLYVGYETEPTVFQGFSHE